MKQRLMFLTLMTFGCALLYSCNDDESDTKVVYEATLNGASERPDPTPSTATGTATLTFNKDTKIFTVVVTFNGVTATNGHIHKGAVGEAGPAVFPFTSFTSPISYTSAALTSDQEADLSAGLYYVNIHSNAYPAGEIRGQLLKK